MPNGIPNNQAVIRERRDKLFNLLVKGMRSNDIAKELKVDVSTVNRDIQFLTSESQNYLNDLAKQTLPFAYYTTLESIRAIMRECWDIYNSDPNAREDSKFYGLNWNNKLSALRLARECAQSHFECLSQGPNVLQLRILEDRLAQIEGSNTQQITQ